VLGEGVGTRWSFDPVDTRNGLVEDQSGGGRDLRSDAVARDQRDTVPSTHGGTLPDGSDETGLGRGALGEQGAVVLRHRT
jgi:hypothetical protein